MLQKNHFKSHFKQKYNYDYRMQGLSWEQWQMIILSWMCIRKPGMNRYILLKRLYSCIFVWCCRLIKLDRKFDTLKVFASTNPLFHLSNHFFLSNPCGFTRNKKGKKLHLFYMSNLLRWRTLLLRYPHEGDLGVPGVMYFLQVECAIACIVYFEQQLNFR